MIQKTENLIRKFTSLTGLTQRAVITHGTLYVLLHQPERCDFFHHVIRDFYKSNINPDGGVNMHVVGDEFAFDFVEGPEDNYAPYQFGPYEATQEEPEEEKGIWSEFAEEELLNNHEPIDSQIDTMLQLENEMEMGK